MTEKEQAQSPRRPLTAGGEIDAWCTKCKMDLGHRIVAMVESAPKRVMCMTCNSEHNYRGPKSETAKTPRKKAATKKSATAKKTAAAFTREEWEVRVRSGGNFKRYTISETFEDNELVTHKKFGDGYVTNSNAATGKVIVAFVDGERTLIQGAQL